MSYFKYTDREKELNKVLKYNQDISNNLLHDDALASSRAEADACIASSEKLLRSLGYEKKVSDELVKPKSGTQSKRLEHRPSISSWDDIVAEAGKYVPTEVILEDLLSTGEMDTAFRELDEINAEFSRRTSIINKTDLSFLALATGLQVLKVMLFPYVAEHFDYGKSFNSAERLAHDDNSIKQAQRTANDKFRDKALEKNKAGRWINILYQTPPYDTTVGSKALGINMGGGYHRLYTLGHDPILGWFFGTANILTDIITLNSFKSYRVERVPNLHITPQVVSLGTMLQESYHTIREDALNLPAAIFAQAQHFKSDAYTKVGLPVPILATINESLASTLYKEKYDAICFSRDMKIIGGSAMISMLIDIIIGLVHGFFRKPDDARTLYEVRTRKILLISNSIASTSSIIRTCLTKNPKQLDIGSLLVTLTHLFTDIRFIARIKQEFIESQISEKLRKELDEINWIYDNL